MKVDSKTREQLDKFKEEKKIEKEAVAGHRLENYDIEDDEDTKVQYHDTVYLKLWFVDLICVDLVHTTGKTGKQAHFGFQKNWKNFNINL